MTESPTSEFVSNRPGDDVHKRPGSGQNWLRLQLAKPNGSMVWCPPELALPGTCPIVPLEEAARSRHRRETKGTNQFSECQKVVGPCRCAR